MHLNDVKVSIVERQKGVRMIVKFEYRKLRGKIREKFSTETAFAEVLGITKTGLSKKLNCASGFSQNDILKWCELLDIEIDEIPVYFFA